MENSKTPSLDCQEDFAGAQELRNGPHEDVNECGQFSARANRVRLRNGRGQTPSVGLEIKLERALESILLIMSGRSAAW